MIEKRKMHFAIMVFAVVCISCQSKSSKPKGATKSYRVFEIRNKRGVTAKFCENGARLMSLMVPNRNGDRIDVVIGFEKPEDYDSATEPYFGATIGRYGNRIAKGQFKLSGKQYHLSINNGENTLHGGKTGFQYRIWKMVKIGDSALICSLHSPDGDNGFPGNLDISVTYTLNSRDGLEMRYEAVTDKETVVNLTNHAFFNLNGSGNILGHELQISAARYNPVDSGLIPLGMLSPVAGTPFDFRGFHKIGERIGAVDQQLEYGRGYDHNFVVDGKKAAPVAIVRGEHSGIEMRIFSTEPGLQFYSGNFMQGKNTLRNGKDEFRTAFCLETQHFPDSPNKTEFPSTVLRPGEKYTSSSEYIFNVYR
ncbi:galactose-1-epimerase [Pedobacter sp. KBW01]|uniref:aldose epimerase family protein n=1 Tax=Pedobacter sp. KBW01 TaxID=2153364 RepID=UPI000F5B542A|nr:aldose epimerase family protein [Pedobacter sp. KBW01]RQO77763.1 galactose-1-epimerase [Pedobacter sp. KBW01]